MARPKGPLSDVERERNIKASRAAQDAHVLRNERLAAEINAPRGDEDADGIPAAFTDGDDGLIQSRYKAYLKRYGIPRDWNEALTAEKVRREISVSVGAGLAVDEQRGKLVPKDSIKASVNAMRDILYNTLQEVPAKVCAELTTLPNNLKPQLVASMSAQIDAACSSAIAEALKKHG